jgi:sulfide:quinone oxidoreductase
MDAGISTLSGDMRGGATPPRYDVLIVGGGAAGITVAAGLRRHRPSLGIAIIEPSDTHSYQPGWTLVGAGVFTLEQTRRREETLIPPGVTWIRDAATGFDPEQALVALSGGRSVAYRMLVVCPGLQLDWDKVEGLRDALGSDGVCSNYDPRHAEYTWACLEAFHGGTMPIKCAGAPQKIMYLAADRFRKQGLLAASRVEFMLSGDVLFGVPAFVPPLEEAVAGYGIQVNYRHTLKAVDGPARKAVFSTLAPDGTAGEIVRDFDMLHVTPPQGPPDFIKASKLAGAGGWVDIDPATMRHVVFSNVFALGDAGSTPNAKTAAAVRLQAPVVVRNLLASLDGKALDAAYDGYGSCPLTTAYGRVVLAEFCYGGTVTPSFPLDPRVPRLSAWLLKTRFLPYMYWQWMLKGSEVDIPHRERALAKAA